jgi:hypothetical protein
MAKKPPKDNDPSPKKKPSSVVKSVVKQVAVVPNKVDDAAKKATEESKNTTAEILALLQATFPVMKTMNSRMLGSSMDNLGVLSSIRNTLEAANDQRTAAADLAEERDAESKAEAMLIEERKNENVKDQNAEIITKLTTLDESINGIDVGADGSEGGGGLMDILSGLTKTLDGLLSTGLKAIMGQIMPLLLAAVPVLLPILAALITAGAAYGLGTLLYNLWVEPAMDASTKDMEDNVLKTSKGIESTQVTDDKGEKVVSMMTGEGENEVETMMTESQAIEHINKSAIPEDKKKLRIESLKSGELVTTQDAEGNTSGFSPVSNKKDKSGLATGVQFKSGSSIADLESQKKAHFDEMKENPAQHYAKQIVAFDENFRQTLTALAKHFSDKDWHDPSIALQGGTEFNTALDMLFNEHKSIIAQIRNAGLKEADLKYLDQEVSPLFNTAFIEGNNPNWSAAGEKDWWSLLPGVEIVRGFQTMTADYDLPNSESIGIGNILLGNIEQEIGPIGVKGNEIRTGLGAESPPAMRDGGFVKESPSDQGRTINVAEAGTGGEFIVPYEKMGILLADAQTSAEGTEVGERITGVMRDSYLDERDSTAEPSSVVVNNINQNSRGGGGGDGGANFQFQTDLARTFDNIFDMILEKNMRTGVL